jgi:outer membrane protein assembly factor BamA
MQRVYRLFDDSSFYLTLGDDFTVEQNHIFSQTGATAGISYPLDFNHRIALAVGYQRRELSFSQQADVPLDVAIENGFLTSFLIQLGVEDAPIDEQVEALLDAGFEETVLLRVPGSEPRTDNFPFVQASLVGDSIVYTQFGPHTGRAYRLTLDYAPDVEGSGTLTQAAQLDYREYIPLGRRMNFALRGFGYTSSGNAPSPTYFGGLDTVRGFEFRSLAGNNGFFTNIELRFPLVDVLATPLLAIQNIRGYVFLDVAGAWFDEFQDFNFWDDDNRLDDGVSSYGFGIGMNLLGLPVNWDFSKRWDFKDTLQNGFETSFWIGQRF